MARTWRPTPENAPAVITDYVYVFPMCVRCREEKHGWWNYWVHGLGWHCGYCFKEYRLERESLHAGVNIEAGTITGDPT